MVLFDAVPFGCRHNWEVGDLADLAVLAVYDHDSQDQARGKTIIFHSRGFRRRHKQQSAAAN